MASISRASDMGVERGRRIVGPERARHDIADGLDRRIRAGQPSGEDGLGKQLGGARAKSPHLKIAARGKVDMAVAVAARGMRDDARRGCGDTPALGFTRASQPSPDCIGASKVGHQPLTAGAAVMPRPR